MVLGSNLKFLFAVILFLSISCQESKEFFDNPEKFLETEDFPSYILKISYNGVNGSNLLQGLEEDTPVDIKGIYVKGKGMAFIRTFCDSGLSYVPLKDAVPEFNSEASVVEIKGRVKTNGEACLEGIKIKSVDDIEKIKKVVEHEYPLLLERIKSEIRNPKSNNRALPSVSQNQNNEEAGGEVIRKEVTSTLSRLSQSKTMKESRAVPKTSTSHLSLDIKDWHLAARGDEILVFGRTYDLMYEFDIGILVRKSDDTYILEKIYAREFFKGE